VKQELEEEYLHHFQTARFARRGGPPGTTAKIEAWLAALSKVINSGKLSPALVASILCFLEAPLLQEGVEQAIPEGVEDVGGNMKQAHGGVAAVSKVHASTVHKKAHYAEATTSGILAVVHSAPGQIEEATTSGFLAASASTVVDAETISELLAAVSATEAAEPPEQPQRLSFRNNADDSTDDSAEQDIEGAADDADGSYGSSEEGPAEAHNNNNNNNNNKKLLIFHA